MREIKPIGSQLAKKVGKHILTDEKLTEIAEFLNSREGQHINYVFFDKNNVYSYS